MMACKNCDRESCVTAKLAAREAMETTCLAVNTATSGGNAKYLAWLDAKDEVERLEKDCRAHAVNWRERALAAEVRVLDLEKTWDTVRDQCEMLEGSVLNMQARAVAAEAKLHAADAAFAFLRSKADALLNADGNTSQWVGRCIHDLLREAHEKVKTVDSQEVPQ